MLRAAVLGFLVAVAACTGSGSSGSTGTDAGVGTTTAAAKQAHVGKFACRAACWADIPYNACRDQRNACYQQAADHEGKVHCREMSRECRKVRRDCLQACNPGAQATEATD